MENVTGEQDLGLQQHFPKISSKFSKNLICRINLLFNARGFKLGHCAVFYMLFPFLVSLSYNP